jgi:hypothetical protein
VKGVGVEMFVVLREVMKRGGLEGQKSSIFSIGIHFPERR